MVTSYLTERAWSTVSLSNRNGNLGRSTHLRTLLFLVCLPRCALDLSPAQAEVDVPPTPLPPISHFPAPLNLQVYTPVLPDLPAPSASPPVSYCLHFLGLDCPLDWLLSTKLGTLGVVCAIGWCMLVPSEFCCYSWKELGRSLFLWRLHSYWRQK